MCAACSHTPSVDQPAGVLPTTVVPGALLVPLFAGQKG
jgi:hypothetical protein